MKNENTLWMGDLEPWMNELVIKKSFIENGFNPKKIKFIKDKKNNIFQNYCFIYFDSMIDANNALSQLNGKKILNTNFHFKLNWGVKISENYKIVYVGNLPKKINDIELYNYFKSIYPSVHHASIARENGVSKRFGFVNFIDDEDYQKCLKEMDGAIFHKNIIRVKERIKKNNEKEHIEIKDTNLNYIKSFYPKKKDSEGISKTDNDETTVSSHEKEQDFPNLNFAEKRKFSDNIELLESNNIKILLKNAQETVNKMFEYWKINSKSNEISNMILYYSSNINQPYYN